MAGISDYTPWDARNKFSISDAACLWYSINPYAPAGISSELAGDISAIGNLIHERFKEEFDARSLWMLGSYDYNAQLISRDFLVNLAEELKVKPPFLFKSEREVIATVKVEINGKPEPEPTGGKVFPTPDGTTASAKNIDGQSEPKRSQIKTQSHFERKMREKIKSELEAGLNAGRRPKTEVILLELDTIIENKSITGKRTSDGNYRRWITQEAKILGMESNRGAKSKKEKARSNKK